MKFQFLLVLLAFVALVSCRNNKTILAENVERMYVDYDVYTPNNLGEAFKGTVSVMLKTGEDIQLKNNKGFNSSDNIDIDIKDSYITVFGPLKSFKTNKIPVQLFFKDKNDIELTFQDSVLINFMGNSKAWYTGFEGNVGQAGENGKTPLLFRDGTDGTMGNPGENGGNGDQLEVYVWANGDTTFYYVFNVTRNYGDRYKVIGNEAKLYIDARGGNGGTGGKGGDGGDGKKGEVSSNSTKFPGNGGRGGNGGQGGRGGNGGRVTVNVHPTIPDINMRLVVDVSGGYSGSGGSGGTGGKGGSPATGQTEGMKGTNGSNGMNGVPGFLGQISIINRTFDYQSYL